MYVGAFGVYVKRLAYCPHNASRALDSAHEAYNVAPNPLGGSFPRALRPEDPLANKEVGW